MLPVKQLNIPEELRQCAQWVLWRVVDKGGHVTKLPYQASGELAKTNDPETWMTFDKAIQLYALGTWDGIGFVFTEEDPYCGVDLDGCRDPKTGRVEEWAKKLIVSFSSYAEVSPSETGVKIWVKGGWTYSGNKQILDTMSKVTEKTPAIEVYDRLRYFAVTGAVLVGQNRITERQAVLDSVRDQFWKESTVETPGYDFRAATSVVERARKYLEKMPVSVSGQNGHGAAYTAACRMVIGFGLGFDEALAVLSEWNSGCQPPWSDKELRHKITSAMSEPGERGYLRYVAPQNYDRIAVPHHKMPKMPTEPPKMITLQEATNKFIERVRQGEDKLIDLGIPELDYAVGGGVAPGEMVLVCARPSHGKSCCSLQMVHHWTSSGMPSLIVSEEMTHLMLGRRTIQFASSIPQEHWETRVDVLQHDSDHHFANRAECYIQERCLHAEVAAEAIRRAKRDHNITCAVVDYAQLLGSPGKERYQQITNTCLVLRQVTSETGIVMVALCQLNREIEKRKSFTPVMADIRETGQFEQDADVIIFAVWPHRIDPDNDPNVYQFYVCKNRNRGINTPVVTCRFEPSRQRFQESRPAEPEGGYFPKKDGFSRRVDLHGADPLEAQFHTEFPSRSPNDWDR